MTATAQSPVESDDRPRRAPLDREHALELTLSAGAAVIVVAALLHLTGWDAPFGVVVCWFAGFVLTYGIVVRERHGVLELKDRLATVFVYAGTVVALIPLFFLLEFVVLRGSHVLFNHFPHFPFLRQDQSAFKPSQGIGRAGMKEAIVGTLEQVGVATLLTVPVGILAATYINEIGGRFASVVRTVADAMTGLPSIIAGLFIYAAWVTPHKTKGWSGFAAALALSVVMLPTVVRTAEEVLRIVSDHLREAALALGSPEWRMVLRVVLPTARTGLVTATILGVARAVGETAPVLLTAFGSERTNFNVFRGPQDDLPLRIYQLARTPSNTNVSVAWGGALLLTLIILTLFSLARILGTGGGPDRRWSPARLARRFTGR